MKALIPLLLVSTSALAVTTFQFAHRASVERKRADDASQLNARNQTRIRELEQSRGNIEHQLMEAQRPRMVTPDGDLAKRAAPAPSPASAQFSVAGHTLPQGAVFSRTAGAFHLGPQPASPAAQRYQRMEMKNSVRKQYADLASSLGLSQGKADKLYDLLAEQRMPPVLIGPQTGDNAKQMAQAFQESRANNEAALAALLGEQGMAQWRDYQKTLGEHMQANMIADQMQTMGAPITDDQRAELYAILVEEPQRSAQQAAPQADGTTPPEEIWKQALKSQDERDHAVLERAKSVLMSEQFALYSDYVAWQSDMRNRTFAPFPGMRLPPSGVPVPVVVAGPNGGVMVSGSGSFTSVLSSASSSPPKQ